MIVSLVSIVNTCMTYTIRLAIASPESNTMGTCGLCGSEVKDTPYRESVSKPELPVVPKKADTFWIRVADNKMVALLILGLTVSGIIYAVDGLFHYTPGMHAAIGFATLTVVLVAMAALPYRCMKTFVPE